MKERPILFSGEMVRAILDGRKTQTRRAVKLPKKSHWVNAAHPDNDGFFQTEGLEGYWHAEELTCPYGKPGDRLWVRENFRCNGWASDVATIFYQANQKNSYTEMCKLFPVENKTPLRVDGKWKPSIHMPRWASRITLEITNVRVERLQDINDSDCFREGIEVEGEGVFYGGVPGAGFGADSPYQAFAQLWTAVNGPDSWKSNPWVWVVEFKRI